MTALKGPPPHVLDNLAQRPCGSSTSGFYFKVTIENSERTHAQSQFRSPKIRFCNATIFKRVSTCLRRLSFFFSLYLALLNPLPSSLAPK